MVSASLNDHIGRSLGPAPLVPGRAAPSPRPIDMAGPTIKLNFKQSIFISAQRLIIIVCLSFASSGQPIKPPKATKELHLIDNWNSFATH